MGFADELKAKASELLDDAKDVFEDAKDKAGDLYEAPRTRSRTCSTVTPPMQ